MSASQYVSIVHNRIVKHGIPFPKRPFRTAVQGGRPSRRNNQQRQQSRNGAFQYAANMLHHLLTTNTVFWSVVLNKKRVQKQRDDDNESKIKPIVKRQRIFTRRTKELVHTPGAPTARLAIRICKVARRPTGHPATEAWANARRCVCH